MSGVAAGLVLAAFFALIDHVRTRTRRRDQIAFLTNLIADYRGKIYEITGDIPHPSGGPLISAHQQRKVLHGDFLRQLDSALNGPTSDLTYDEVESIRSVFWGAYHRLLGDRLWPAELYVRTFKRAESIEWLDLPSSSQQPSE